jgi:thiamine-phosphate pyrophosphorylase
MKNIAKIQYISPNYSAATFLENLAEVIAGGIDWIQIRVKDIDELHYLEIATQAVSLCKQQGVTCIINDNPYITKSSGADGVHLGKQDMKVTLARKFLGKDVIIGGTANTFADIQNLAHQGVDYIGLGPFRFTTTKKDLSPIVGIEGYRAIMERCKQTSIRIPIIAIGGITVDDIPSIMETGVNGIAVSGFISTAKNKKETISLIKELIH